MITDARLEDLRAYAKRVASMPPAWWRATVPIAARELHELIIETQHHRAVARELHRLHREREQMEAGHANG